MTEEERQKMRKKRQRARKRKKVRKKFLLTIVLIIILLAVFVTTIKIVNPTFDLSAYFPRVRRSRQLNLLTKRCLKILPPQQLSLLPKRLRLQSPLQPKRQITIMTISAFLPLTLRFRAIKSAIFSAKLRVR